MTEQARVGQEARKAAGGFVSRLLVQWPRLERELWRRDPGEILPLRALRAIAQLVALTIQGFQSDQLLLRASALTYVTALSIIPLLAVAFAMLGIVGGDERLIDFAIDQLTTAAPGVRETVRGYVGNLDFASFGTVGGTILFATGILALRHLERTLNEIWGVAHSRSWGRRFSDYLAVMVVAPITTGVALSLATTFQSEPMLERLLGDPIFARLYGMGMSTVPALFLFFGFTFLFWFFPNTRVRLPAAALGGLVTAFLFLVARGIYVDFQVGAATYQAVFGALSAVPLILAWLYVCWAVVLLGAEVSFAAQNLGAARREMRSREISPAHREAVALEVAVEVARCFRGRVDPPTAEALAEVLDEPLRLIRRLLKELEEAGLVRAILPYADADPGHLPSGPLREISVGAVLRAIRGESEASGEPASVDPTASRMLARLAAARDEIADGTTLEDLSEAAGEPGTRA